MNKQFLVIFSFFLVISSLVTADVASDLNTFLQVECSVKPISRVSGKGVNSKKHGSHSHLPSETAGSYNWSGYVSATSLTDPASGSVSKVQGSWTVPVLSSSTIDTYCSIWVGIDGFTSGTVEQIGTEHDWRDGAQSNYAWFEMYPGGAYELIGFPVNPHDVMGATVLYQGYNTFQLSIINYTRNTYTIIPSYYTKSSVAARSCAEWVVEAPYYGGILPLARFGTVSFTNCLATIRGLSGPINYYRWSNEPVIMVTPGGVVKSLPSTLSRGGESFRLTWEHQ